MADNMFSYTTEDLLNLRRFYKQAPKTFGRSVVGMLNGLAFHARVELLETIEDQMIVRNRKFVSSKMRVEKARGHNISNAVSRVGSISGPRFTGWEEQETGKADQRERTYSEFSRGGNQESKISSRRSRKRSNEIMKITDFNISNAKNDTHRVIIFLQMIDRKHRNKMFFMPENHGRLLDDSVYLIAGRRKRKTKRAKSTGGAIRRISRDHSMRTGKQPWMEPTINRQINPSFVRHEWAKNVNKNVLIRLK